MNKTLSLILLVGLAAGFGCKKDNDATPDTCGQVSARAQTYSNAVSAYSTSPTKANCEAVRTTANSYLDAAANCPTVTQADITAARASVNALVCQ